MTLNRHSSLFLLCIGLSTLAACGSAKDLSGTADRGSVEESEAVVADGPVTALEGFDGALDPWGSAEGSRVVASKGYLLIGVADPAAVLVLDIKLSADVDAVVDAFRGSEQSGESGEAGRGIPVFLADSFASAGGSAAHVSACRGARPA